MELPRTELGPGHRLGAQTLRCNVFEIQFGEVRLGRLAGTDKL